MNENQTKILLIEDNPGDALLIREMLKNVGARRFELEHVDRLSKGLKRLAEKKFDLLLLDLGLPDSQGLETLKRAYAYAKNVSIVILTGLADETVGIEAVREGAQDYLIKGQVNETLLVRSIFHAIERKKAEEALRESEMKLKSLFEILPVGISILDAERKITFMNPALERIIDISMEGLLREDYTRRTYLRPDGTPMPAEEYASTRAKKEQRAVHNVEIGVVKEDGNVIWTNVSAVPVAFPDWEVVIVTSDITERKKAEEELMSSKNEVEFLNDLMSHDLTNINQATLGFLELLGGTELTEIQRKYFSSTMYSARRNARLIDNVKKIQKGRFGPPSPTDLNACIEEAMKSILPPPKKILKINYDPRPCLVLGNDLLKDVVSNLLDNAMKFDTLEEVIIDIAVSDEGDMCKLSVKDRESRIPDKYKKSIFSRLERLEKGIKGSGLGLHLVKTIVEGCGGEVRVEDNSPKGSIFSILLRKVG